MVSSALAFLSFFGDLYLVQCSGPKGKCIIYLPAHPSVYLSVCLSVCIFVLPSVQPSIYPSLCLSVRPSEVMG